MTMYDMHMHVHECGVIDKHTHTGKLMNEHTIKLVSQPRQIHTRGGGGGGGEGGGEGARRSKEEVVEEECVGWMWISRSA